MSVFNVDVSRTLLSVPCVYLKIVIRMLRWHLNWIIHYNSVHDTSIDYIHYRNLYKKKHISCAQNIFAWSLYIFFFIPFTIYYRWKTNIVHHRVHVFQQNKRRTDKRTQFWVHSTLKKQRYTIVPKKNEFCLTVETME